MLDDYGSVPSVPSVMDLRVEPDKLTEVAKVIETQANALADKINAQVPGLVVASPSQDRVSTLSVGAWNQVISDGAESYLNRVLAYVDGLRDLGEQLRRAAAEYERFDDETAASLGDRANR